MSSSDSTTAQQTDSGPEAVRGDSRAFPSAVRTGGRVNGIDGLRTLAVMLVITYHFNEGILPGGSIGVDVFYTISGFVITRLLIAEYARTGDIGLRQFYRRRWLRLVPALLMVCALTAVLTLSPLQSFKNGWTAGLLAAVSLVNIVRAAQSGAYTGITSPLGHTWSLGVEEQFYVLWPPLLLSLLRRLNGRTVLVCVSVLGLLPVLWRFHLWDPTQAHRIYNGPDTRADQLLAGAVLAILLARLGADDPWRRTLGIWAGRLWPPALALLCLIAWRVPITGASAWEKPVYTVGFLVVALLTVVLLASLELRPRAPLARLLSLLPLAWVGRNLSYGLYLWHYPLMHALRDLGVDRMLLPATLATSFVAAVASYYLIEAPCQRLKHRKGGKPSPVTAVVPAVALPEPAVEAVGRVP